VPTHCGIWIRAVLLLVLLTLAHASNAQTPATEGAELRVALITAAPGAIYWERFGHNAILIEDTQTGDSRMYNFGWFDFEQENFLLNFVRGRMLYLLAATNPAQDIANYRAEGRSVWMQELDLSAAQKFALARKLSINAQPENAEYRYDYYVSNCSTKVRDALDEVLDGALRQQSLGRGRGETYRSLSLAYARPIPWLALGIHLGLGPSADRRINFWEEAFLPLRLRDLVDEIQLRDEAGVNRPLVSAKRTLFAGALDDQIPAQPNWFWYFLFTGCVGAALVGSGLLSQRPGLRTVAAFAAASISLIIGLLGLGLIGLWFATDHSIAWRNANIGLVCPLSLLLLLPLWRLRLQHRATTNRVARIIASIVVLSALALVASVFLKLNIQAQSDWLVLLLPWHVMVWAVLQKK
jgi:Domain of unknown function (DUF4105)